MRSRPVLPAAVLAFLALGAAACATGAGDQVEPEADVAQAESASLQQVTSFGANPGNLLMYAYAPTSAGKNAPLVVALHGCGEAATDYEAAGWNALADRYGFYVVYPQQQSANNIEECFNWFGNTSGSTADITRGQGEAESVIEMIKAMEAAHSIDPKRVFVNGFSAGAAYAVALLAMYPDVFAAGSSFSGVPFGCANSLSTAYPCMDAPTTKTPAQWGDLARAAYPGYAGPYPRLSVWQGSMDSVVNTANLSQIVSQWTNVTGASSTPSATGTVGGFPHQQFKDSKGVVQVESFSVTGMPHAVSLDVSAGCGAASTYFVDEKVCAVAYSAAFFGIGPAIAYPAPDGGPSGGGSGGGGSGSGGSGSGGGSSSGGSGGGSGGASGGSSGGAADEPDAGAAPPADMPGCTVGRHASGGSGTPLVLALVAGAALRRRRAARSQVTSREEQS